MIVKKGTSGMTLIELVMAVVIGALIIIPLLGVFTFTLNKSNSLDVISTALNLANSKMEFVSQKSFNTLTTEAASSFGGNFSDYYGALEVHYVASSELNTSVDPTGTAYKWLQVTVTTPLQPGLNLQLRGLATDLTNP